MEQGEINGHGYELKTTSPNRMQELDRVDQMLRDYEGDEFYMFNEEFRAKYFKALADVILDWEDGFNPTKEFYKDGDFEVSELQKARRAFLGNVGMIGI